MAHIKFKKNFNAEHIIDKKRVLKLSFEHPSPSKAFYILSDYQ